ncbi:hypothetical protein FACS1894132_01970 [Clostridia bacterium]|nr:hypothetical protein FACS1894132_01970 [Clostridia bacterium]
MSVSIIYAPSVKVQVQIALDNCLKIIIPSLYGFMILSDLAVRTNIYKIIGKPFFIFAKLFNIPKEYVSIFIIAHLGGYPVGIKLICDLLDKKAIGKKLAERLSLYCVASGPAFIVGTVSGVLYANPKVALLLFLSVSLANFLIAIITGLFSDRSDSSYDMSIKDISSKIVNRDYKVANSVNETARTQAGVACETARTQAGVACIYTAVDSVAKVMLKICSMILMCAVVIGLIKTFCDNAFLNSVIDVTNIVFVKDGDYNILPIIAALLSFGGLCVALQIFSIAFGKINIWKFLYFRVIAALFSYIICKLLYPLLVSTVPTSTMHFTHEQSILPSLILIIMSFMIISKSSFAKK